MSDTPNNDNDQLDDFMAKYLALARKCKREQRMLMNHVCVRVENIDRAEAFLEQSFGLTGFLRPGGELFSGERELSVLWINDDFYLELIEPRDDDSVYAEFLREQGPGLHHIMFVTPDYDACVGRMQAQGIPVLGAGELQRSRFQMFDTREDLGLICEIAEGEPLIPDRSNLD